MNRIKPLKRVFQYLAGPCLEVGVILAVTMLLCFLAGGSTIVLDAVSPSWAAPEAISEISQPDTRNADSLVDFALFVSFVAYSALALVVLAVARLHGGHGWRDLIAWYPWNIRQSDRRFWLLFAATLAYGLAADLALRHFHPPSEAWFAVPKDFARAGAIFVLAVVFAPIVEELIFRGYIYTILRRLFGALAALLVSSALFASLHYESTHLYALVVFPMGIALGLIREITGSVKPAIAFHAFNNFLAMGFTLLDHV